MALYVWTKTLTGETTNVHAVPRDATIEMIDGEFCAGRCECCRVPLKESDDYVGCAEGTILCRSCLGE